MASVEDHSGSGDDRLLATLQRLLALRATELKPTLDRASGLIADALGADKVDVFLHERGSQSLVAVGMSDTLMGRRERATGLDRLPVADGGRTVDIFRTGTAYRTGRADRDSGELVGVTRELGVRSTLGVPLEVDGERRGVLLASSAKPHAFSERDLAFLQAVSGWVGLVARRAELAARPAGDVAGESGGVAAAALIGILTPRQREVAALVARGLSNKQIAQLLVVTPGTVANHVEQILRRLGLASRTQVALWAVECGLRPPDAGEGGP